jgi:predicted nucleic acid-binding protein
VTAGSLATCDGTAGTLVDTNIWIDCIDSDSPWHAWAVEQLQTLSERSALHVNLVIYTELLVPVSDVDALDALLDVYDTRRTHLPWECASLTATAFALYRSRGGSKLKPVPDFYIGAHAAIANLRAHTRSLPIQKLLSASGRRFTVKPAHGGGCVWQGPCRHGSPFT